MLFVEFGSAITHSHNLTMKLIGRLNTLGFSATLPHKQTTQSSDWQTHPLYVGAQHWSSPGLCAQPPPFHTQDYFSHSGRQSQTFSIVKYVDNSTNNDRITNRNESSYWEEINSPAEWSTENHLLLNMSKIKELIVDLSKKEAKIQKYLQCTT